MRCTRTFVSTSIDTCLPAEGLKRFSLVVVDTSKVDLAYATDLCGQVTGTLHDAINEVQAACTLAESAVAVEVGVDTLIEAIGGVLVVRITCQSPT